MNKRSVEVQDGEYYVDMSKKPQRTIWELAAISNAKRKVVRRHVCRDDSVFTIL